MTVAAVWARPGLPEPRSGDPGQPSGEPGQPSGEPEPPELRAAHEPAPPQGLYVHFPFCLSICPYCDFVVVAGSAARGPHDRIEALLSAQLTEIGLRAESLPCSPLAAPLGSVYLGGGTPSLMSPGQVERLLAHVDARLGIAADAEVTLEVNPGPAELGDLAGFRAAGVNRLSIGAQSLAASELRRLARRHRPDDVTVAVEAARQAGFASLGLDLLTDIPDQSLASWRGTLGLALALGPEHLSVYTLTLDDPDAEGLSGPLGDHLPLRRGARAWRVQARAEQSEDRAAEMELLTDELAARAGLQRYEISNLAHPGFESRHNRLYWRRRPYMAIGPGAHASDGARVRTWNAARLDPYLAALSRGRLPPGGHEIVDDETARAESAILGLRLVEGIDAELAAHPDVAPALRWAREQGLTEESGTRTRLTQRGRLLADEVFTRLLPARVMPSRVGPTAVPGASA